MLLAGDTSHSSHDRSHHVPVSNGHGFGIVSLIDRRYYSDFASQSLAQALYFAARGVGQIRTQKDAEPQPYTSRARVLLNGLGSDELLGGYGRHRTAYNAGGWTALIREVGRRYDFLFRPS